jgi:hypothetical protein
MMKCLAKVIKRDKCTENNFWAWHQNHPYFVPTSPKITLYWPCEMAFILNQWAKIVKFMRSMKKRLVYFIAAKQLNFCFVYSPHDLKQNTLCQWSNQSHTLLVALVHLYKYHMIKSKPIYIVILFSTYLLSLSQLNNTRRERQCTCVLLTC